MNAPKIQIGDGEVEGVLLPELRVQRGFGVLTEANALRAVYVGELAEARTLTNEAVGAVAFGLVQDGRPGLSDGLVEFDRETRLMAHRVLIERGL